MRDDQIRGLLRTLEDDREPDPAFADALYERLNLVARNQSRSRAPMILLAAALLLGVLVAGIALGSRLIELPMTVDGTATPSPTASAVAIASPQPSAEPTSEASPDAIPDADPALLAGRTLFAEADGLRLRAEPSETGELVATLRRGQLMGATGNQQSAGGMEWYEVRIGPGGVRGWVAAGPEKQWLRLVHDGAIAFRCEGCGVSAALVSVTPFGDASITTIAEEELQDYRWSPDGTRLAVTIAGATGSSVAVVDADGSNRRVLASNGHAPAWSPDGTRLAWSIGSTLVVTDENLAPTELALDVRSPGNVHWSPDGSRLAFSAIDCPACPADEPIIGDPPSAIFMATVDGSDARMLIGGDYWGVTGWAPDGTAIAGLLFNLSGDFPTRAFVMAADGGEPAFLLDGAGVSGPPAWSPDGTRLAVATTDGLVVMSGDGSDPRVVAADAETGIWEVAWAPSGRYLVYRSGGSSAGTGLGLWVVPADGSGPAQRISPEDAAAQMAAWQPLLVPLP